MVPLNLHYICIHTKQQGLLGRLCLAAMTHLEKRCIVCQLIGQPQNSCFLCLLRVPPQLAIECCPFVKSSCEFSLAPVGLSGFVLLFLVGGIIGGLSSPEPETTLHVKAKHWLSYTCRSQCCHSETALLGNPCGRYVCECNDDMK